MVIDWLMRGLPCRKPRHGWRRPDSDMSKDAYRQAEDIAEEKTGSSNRATIRRCIRQVEKDLRQQFRNDDIRKATVLLMGLLRGGNLTAVDATEVIEDAGVRISPVELLLTAGDRQFLRDLRVAV